MGAISRIPTRETIYTAGAANGVGSSANVSDFKNIQLMLSTASNAAMTVKIQGSLAATVPTFSSAASATNPWTFIAAFDLIDPTTVIAGGTGVAYTGTDAVKSLLVNVDGLTFLNVQISGYSAGTLNATAVMFTNS